MAPKQTDPQFKLRMTPEIKRAIEMAAFLNNRSMNAEILHRLQMTIDIDAMDEAPAENAHPDERTDLERILTAVSKLPPDMQEAAITLVEGIARMQKK